jgi:tetratricopeptide (TPR) repeat protein
VIRRRCGVSLALVAVLATSGAAEAEAASTAAVREYAQVFVTYPYSDPNPIPVPGRIYPYFRFDGYTDAPVDRAWKVVELENAYLKVLILPEIGGKIWAAIAKTTGQSFIYYNHVVKFRDIAMRGPWTSGGIEPNYGIIGHTPNCATPVDYVTSTHEDGSASVTIGVLDLLTRTPWRLEIALPADAAYFTTRSLWQNTSPLEQPYYSWMNAALPARDNLQFVFPGTHYLGHDGSVSTWPIEEKSGKDLSFYEQNDFGSYKSYHVFGKASDFFGAYWHDRDFGMARYSTRDDKAGKKIWIWGLSQQGMIWERLLTDDDGQYVEVQSGRLFNQAAPESSRTPFKNRGFAPGATDSWTEYWMPVKGTRGLVKANGLGALNVRRGAGRLVVAFSPVQVAAGKVEVFDGATRVGAWDVQFTPLATWTESLDRDVPDERLRVRVLGSRFEYVGDPAADVIARPTAMPENFDLTTAFGLDTEALEAMRQRNYTEARRLIAGTLAREPHYAPALVDAALLSLRAGDYEEAFSRAREALSIDTYDPAANYYYGLAADGLGRSADARDGFEIAAQSPEWRGVAWFQLGRLAVRDGRMETARHYAARAMDERGNDVQAVDLAAVVARLSGDGAAASALVTRLLALDPLNHVARVERALSSGSASDREAVVHGIRNEMPQETFLEMAAFYSGLGRDEDAASLLALAPPMPEVLYWRAWLARSGDPAASRTLLSHADAASPALTFPFRDESAHVFAWAISRSDAWQPRYYLAVLELGRGNEAEARRLLDDLGQRPTFAPFYALRAGLDGTTRAAALADLGRAMELDPDQWRFPKQLVERHIADGFYAEAAAAARRATLRAPGNYVLGTLLARTLLLEGKARDALDVLATLKVLPYEGSIDGRRLYREAHLRLALETMVSDLGVARAHVRTAQEWPEHLGAGKPYDEDIDRRLDDWIAAQIDARAGARAEAAASRNLVITAPQGPAGAGGLVTALALADAGRADEAGRALDAWSATLARSDLAAWGRSLAEGRPTALPLAAPDAGDYGILADLVRAASKLTDPGPALR